MLTMEQIRDALIEFVLDHEKSCPGDGTPCAGNRALAIAFLARSIGIRSLSRFAGVLASASLLANGKVVDDKDSPADEVEAPPCDQPRLVNCQADCPLCGKRFEGFADMTKGNNTFEKALQAGALFIPGICAACAGIIVMDKNHVLRKPTDKEYNLIRNSAQWPKLERWQGKIRQHWVDDPK